MERKLAVHIGLRPCGRTQWSKGVARETVVFAVQSKRSTEWCVIFEERMG